jgi:hypothetical protein
MNPTGLLVVVLAAGCAAAPPTDGGSVADAPDGGVVATLPDGGPSEPAEAMILRQTTTSAITPKNAFVCAVFHGDIPGQNLDNSFYRVFDLTAAGAPNGLDVQSVTVGVESARSPDGKQPITVTLSTLNGDLTRANLTKLASDDLDLADQEAKLVEVPIRATAPAGSKLVVEVSIPAVTGSEDVLFLGSNQEQEIAPSYWSSNACHQPEPATLTAAGFPDMHIVLEVHGLKR